MENIGYAISNKFILLFVDSNLELNMFEGDDKLELKIPNARKVYRISNTTAISIIGLPNKISQIYKYILSIKETDKKIDTIVEDLEAIFNTNKSKIKSQLLMVSAAISKSCDENGVIVESKFFKYFENEPELLQIAKESFQMLQTGNQLGTTIYIFSHEDEKNVFGKYLSLAFNLSGEKLSTILKDNIHFGLDSSMKSKEEVKLIESECSEIFKQYITENWEESAEDCQKLKENIIKAFKISLKKLTPFSMQPNILVYELSADTDNKFKEPDIKLFDIKINDNL